MAAIDVRVEQFRDQTRFSQVYPDDHAGYIWIVALMGIVYTCLAGTLRYHIKFRVYGIDDYLLALATLVHMVQAAVVFYGLHHGLGKFNTITPEDQWSRSSESFLVSEILTVVALCLAKCSVVGLLLRVFASETGLKGWGACIGIMALSAAWGIISIIVLTVDCDAGTILTLRSQCPDQHIRWQIITGLDVTTELINWLLPGALVWRLNMAAGMKLQVIFAFAFRLPLIILTAVHLHYFDDLLRSSEPQFSASHPVIFQQVSLTWSLMSATIPNLKSFMKTFSMMMALPEAWDETRLSTIRPIALKTFRAKATSGAGNPARRSFPGGRRLASQNASLDQNYKGLPVDRSEHQSPERDPGEQEVTISSHPEGKSDTTYGQDMRRSGSRELIIRRDMDWSVEHDTP